LDCDERTFGIYTIFEGTSEIQRLIIARAISGVHVQ
jgi:acyl-CoA dehydrogenase